MGFAVEFQDPGGRGARGPDRGAHASTLPTLPPRLPWRPPPGGGPCPRRPAAMHLTSLTFDAGIDSQAREGVYRHRPRYVITRAALGAHELAAIPAMPSWVGGGHVSLNCPNMGCLGASWSSQTKHDEDKSTTPSASATVACLMHLDATLCWMLHTSPGGGARSQDAQSRRT